MQTKAFKSGNSLAVRIPKGLAIFEPSQDVIIERKGDTLVLRAAERKSLVDLPDIFAQFPKTFMAEGRLPQDQDERDWGDWNVAPSPAVHESSPAVHESTHAVHESTHAVHESTHAVHESTPGQSVPGSSEIASSNARKNMPASVKRVRR
ncbi:MAG: AbrB/MazE/SpoVT family DNA-binding domain-containing protein [Rhizobacter sp.]|nr:AbrB/MazE/SpoVT family DNA-binding domain-containing protein [Burkholderiales bacterium]